MGRDTVNQISSAAFYICKTFATQPPKLRARTLANPEDRSLDRLCRDQPDDPIQQADLVMGSIKTKQASGLLLRGFVHQRRVQAHESALERFHPRWRDYE